MGLCSQDWWFICVPLGPCSYCTYLKRRLSSTRKQAYSRLDLCECLWWACVSGGLFQHVVEDRWRNSAFRGLEKIAFGACKNALEVDLGYLLIACSRKITELQLQPSLTKDSFFMSLIWTDVDFIVFETLSLGFVDAFPEAGKWHMLLWRTHCFDCGKKLPFLCGCIYVCLMNCWHRHWRETSKWRIVTWRKNLQIRRPPNSRILCNSVGSVLLKSNHNHRKSTETGCPLDHRKIPQHVVSQRYAQWYIGWRDLNQRRVDSRLYMAYKIAHGQFQSAILY